MDNLSDLEREAVRDEGVFRGIMLTGMSALRDEVRTIKTDRCDKEDKKISSMEGRFDDKFKDMEIKFHEHDRDISRVKGMGAVIAAGVSLLVALIAKIWR